MIRVFLSRQFLLFLMVGGIAAAVNFFSRIVYDVWVDFSVAVVVAYVTGMVVAFSLFRLFVFSPGSQNVGRSALFFTVVNIAGILQTLIISVGLADYVLPRLGVISFVPEIAHAVGIAVPAFTSYIGHKYWSFR